MIVACENLEIEPEEELLAKEDVEPPAETASESSSVLCALIVLFSESVVICISITKDEFLFVSRETKKCLTLRYEKRKTKHFCAAKLKCKLLSVFYSKLSNSRSENKVQRLEFNFNTVQNDMAFKFYNDIAETVNRLMV